MMASSGNNSSAVGGAPRVCPRQNADTTSLGDGETSPEKRLTHPTTPVASESPHQLIQTAAGAADTTPTSSSANGDDLENQSKEFLVQRVRALERQLTIRNSDCARLLEQRKELLPLKTKCESQRETILALQDQLQLAQVKLESANDAVEAMKRRERDREHRERRARAEQSLYGSNAERDAKAVGTGKLDDSSALSGDSAPRQKPAGSVASSNTRPLPGGTIVTTTLGPQVTYDNSDISSIGFTKKSKLPYDFLGGPGAQLQYLASHPGHTPERIRGELEAGHDAAEEAQVQTIMASTAEAIELDSKYSEMEDRELEALMERLKALREGRR